MRLTDQHRSILYKTRLPFILVFNKTDVQPHDFALEWMTDFEAFQAALGTRGSGGGGVDAEGGYMDSLMGSMCLVLEEFYNNLNVSGARRARPSGARVCPAKSRKTRRRRKSGVGLCRLGTGGSAGKESGGEEDCVWRCSGG